MAKGQLRLDEGTMTDLPENIDLQWIGRHLVEMRDELAAVRADVRSMRDDLNVIAWSVVRLDRNLEQLRVETQRLWLEQGDLRRRIEVLEEART
jgi:hypothetical protein